MRVLVTGGAGFIGSHIVDRLVERGDSVLVVDDLSGGRRANLSPLPGQVLSISNIGTDRDPRELSLWRASAEFLDRPVVASALIDRL